jgi:hypothetical protein
VRATSLREVGRMIGRGREQVRKFVSGDIQNPHDRTREAIARLYLQWQKTGRVAEVRTEEGTPTPLKMILPQGLEKASGEIRAVFERIRAADDAPPTAAALEGWLLRRLKEEYAAERPYPRARQRPARRKTPPEQP